VRAETGSNLRILARAALLVLVAVLTVISTGGGGYLWWVALLAVAAAPGFVTTTPPLLGRFGRFAEVIVVGLGATAVSQGAFLRTATDLLPVSGDRSAQLNNIHHAVALGASAVLIYLAVPLTASIAKQQTSEPLALLAAAVAAMVVGSLALRNDLLVAELWAGHFAISATGWLLVAVFVAVISRALRPAAPEPAPAAAGPGQFSEATRLLTQLRSVARQLPGATLDPGSIAEHLLDEVKTLARCDRAAVLTASGGGRLVVLTESGVDRAEWESTIDADSAVAEAWASQTPQTANRSQTRSHRSSEVSSMVVPLMAGVRTVGLMIIEADLNGAYPADVVDAVAAAAAPASLRLEAALLFDEVRSIATNEERQRLAREIHDGVAQELVMVGYGIDNAIAELPPEGSEASADTLRTLRGEVTRVVTELRLSLFELRSEVDRHGGLAAAISEYARTVGASAGLRVHLSLDESTNRMPAAAEAELLRIAQEAITNARKHAGASNLWVTCEVDPPYARIAVEDDGRGLPDQRPDGRYGLTIMKERTNRVRGRLEISPRHPNGTSVAVVVGSPPGRDSVRDSVNAAETE